MHHVGWVGNSHRQPEAAHGLRSTGPLEYVILLKTLLSKSTVIPRWRDEIVYKDMLNYMANCDRLFVISHRPSTFFPFLTVLKYGQL